MVATDWGINIKSNHAVLFQQHEPSTRSRIKSTPCYRKYSSGYIVFCISESDPTIHNHIIKTHTNLLNNQQKLLSQKSQSRIRNAVNLLIECSKRKYLYVKGREKPYQYKVGFMTLTLPEKQKHSDHHIHYKIFKPFIRILREKYDLAEYLWKAETQDNNNLHYHLTLNVFIHWKDINREWNQLLKKEGYKFSTVDSERASTDIHATKSIKNIAGYLCSYVGKKDVFKRKAKEYMKKHRECKTPQCELPEGWFTEGGEWRKKVVDIKLWDCSLNLKKEKLTVRNGLSQNIELLTEILEIEERRVEFDFYGVILFSREKMKEKPRIGALFRDYIERIRYHGKQSEKYYVNSLN